MFQALDCALFLTQATLVYTAQKMKFSIKNFFNKLVTFTEETLNGKLHFCAVFRVPVKGCQKNLANTQQKQLNGCDWFIDNKISIHFGEDKTKSILFGTKRKLTSESSLDIRYFEMYIRQSHKVTKESILNSDLLHR